MRSWPSSRGRWGRDDGSRLGCGNRLQSMIPVGYWCPSSCGSGGIGRRASLRSLWPQGREGSSPFFRTTLNVPPIKRVLGHSRPRTGYVPSRRHGERMLTLYRRHRASRPASACAASSRSVGRKCAVVDHDEPEPAGQEDRLWGARFRSEPQRCRRDKGLASQINSSRPLLISRTSSARLAGTARA
jgi:hypothetical protein